MTLGIDHIPAGSHITFSSINSSSLLLADHKRFHFRVQLLL